MIKKISITVTLVLFSFLGGYAQQSTASPYSFYGIGSLKFRGTVESRAMAGISTYADSLLLNIQNPATLGKLNLTSYTVGASFSNADLKSDSGNSTANSASFDYLAMGFPISKRLGASFGLVPYTSVGYNLQHEDNSGELSEIARYNGEGGVNKVYASFGYEITNNLSLGIFGSYNFGRVDNAIYNTVEGVQLSTKQLDRTELSGVDYKIALNYEKPLKNQYTLYASAMYTPEAKLTSNNTRNLYAIVLYDDGSEGISSSQEVDLEVLGLKKTDMTIPAIAKLGIGLGKNRDWFVGAEYEMSQSSEFSNPFLSLDGVQYDDSYKMNLGGFWIPDYNSFSSYFKRVTYRMGVHYERLGLVVNEQEINDVGLSLGMSFPVAQLSKINLGIDFGRRGTTDSGLIQENYFNFRVGLSLIDRWFVKSKFD